MRITKNDLRAHVNKFINEEESAFKHFLVDQHGAFSLVNGIWSNKGLSYPDWLGWGGVGMVASIELGAATSLTLPLVSPGNVQSLFAG